MNILLLGSGGREHALAWRLGAIAELRQAARRARQSRDRAHGPTASRSTRATTRAVVDLLHAQRDRPRRHRPRSAAGRRARRCAARRGHRGVRARAPPRRSSKASKGFTKDLCARAGIPTAAYVRVDTDGRRRAPRCDRFALPVVIKADGLAAGKGVTIAETRAEAEAAIADMFGAAGAEVVIEEFLEGEEASLFALTDGDRRSCRSASAQDHKRVGDGDTGPNTGGMGAYSARPRC